MSVVERPELPGHAPTPTPSVEWGVTGPNHQEGFVLRAPRSETLAWDLENEVVSARRCWREETGEWWIAASYLETVVEIVLRSFASVLLLHLPDGDRLVSRDGVAAWQGRLF